MKATERLKPLAKQIDAVREALRALGPIHPGSISEQYQRCGRAGCRCMDPHDPRRHGPYLKLSYVHRGKAVCRFVRADCVEELTRRVNAYKRLRRLLDRWIDLSIAQGRIEFFGKTPPAPHPRKSNAS